MKTIFFLLSIYGIWMSVEGASVIEPKSQSLSNSTIAGIEDECLEKIEDDEDTLDEIFKLKFTFMRIFNKLSQNFKHNSLDSIDKAIEDICYPAMTEGNLYSLTMKIVKLCLNQEPSFNPEDKTEIQNKLNRVFCSVYMKLAAIISFSPDCFGDTKLMNEMEKCAKGQSVNTNVPIREWFFGNPEFCMAQTKGIHCISQMIKGQCSSDISERLDSTLNEAQNIMGCESDPNSIFVVNIL